MANNYLEFSEVLSHLTDPQIDWLRHQLTVIYVFNGQEYDEDKLPEELDPTTAELYGCRAYRELNTYDPDFGEGAGCAYEFSLDQPDGTWGRHLWLYAEEYACLDRVAHLVQLFLRKFRPQECWSLTYATTCSKPRVGEFGGGAVFVTVRDIKWENSHDFIERSAEHLRASGRETPANPANSVRPRSWRRQELKYAQTCKATFESLA